MAEEAKAVVVEEVKNCPSCKKPLKRARRFYRNGAYYCNSNCFKKVRSEAKVAAAEAETAAAQAKAAAAPQVPPETSAETPKE
jgi:predicted  nucleic acid-binding Zn-ribbon protein